MLYRNLGITVTLLSALACSSQYRKETMGVASVEIGKTTETVGVEVVGKHDRLQVSYVVSTPRAMQLHYKLTCPGGQRTGSIGETLDVYRERRLAELERLRQQEVQTKASLVSAVVGSAGGQAQVAAPGAQAQVEAGVDGQALGQAVGESTTAKAQLPSWDLGAQVLKQTVTLSGGEAGHCAMSIWSEIATQDLQGVSGTIKVVQFIDKQRVRQEKRALADEAAIKVRGDLHASLIAAGADPEYRAKLRHAEILRIREAQAKREAKIRTRREAQAKLEFEIRVKRQAEAKREVPIRQKRKARTKVAVKVETKKRVRLDQNADIRLVMPPQKGPRAGVQVTVATGVAEAALRTRASMTTRGRLQAWCRGNGADPYYRARQRKAEFDRLQAEGHARAERERLERVRLEGERKRFELQLGFDLRTRTALVATLIGQGADPEYRRKRDEADLQAFEARARDAQYKELHARNTAATVQAPAQATSTVGSLVVSTQVSRPAAPAAPIVSRPKQPSANATWIAGFYEWQGSAWIWVPGIWSIPPERDAIWIPAVEINLGGSVVLQPGSWRNRSGKRVKGSVRRGKSRSRRAKPHDHR